ncbi:sensor histidine kinase [Thiomicrorhabdus aquaedulcis]|uniref:sensor histidine kinase n=1 Tax=Thiomicrorhabdus aquaedulcis TaxID=2211106 RepID=UPI000FD97546|nr:ATP-binding protein [Thiomicrorhabdus aquaedulcis]
MQSLETQLRNALSVSLLALFLLFWWVTTYSIHQLIEQYVVTRLSHDAEILQRQLTLQNGQWSWDQNSNEVIYQRPQSGHYFWVTTVNADASVPLASLSSPSLSDFSLFAPTDSQHAAVYETMGPKDKMVLVYRAAFAMTDAVSGQKADAYLFVVEDHSPIQNILRQFDWLFGLFSLLGLLGLWWLQKRILKRSFASLQPVRHSLNQVLAGEVASINHQVPKEIAPLVSTLNHVLGQLQSRLERSRQATGNLAHALKSPLNVLYQFLDDPHMNANPALKTVLLEQAKRMEVLIERELSKARTAGRGLSLQTFHFSDDLRDLLASLKQLHIDKIIEYQVVEFDFEGLDFDREDLFELLGNVLDNASKWCQSRVRVLVVLEPMEQINQMNQINPPGLVNAPAIRLVVEDDGQGVSADDMLLMQQRGTRLDESQPGHGLGLSIAADIAKAYGGRLEFSQHRVFIAQVAPLSGLQVSVILPMSAQV